MSVGKLTFYERICRKNIEAVNHDFSLLDFNFGSDL